MIFYVSFMCIKKPENHRYKEIQLDNLLRQFDNRTMDFRELISSLSFIREEINLLDKRFMTPNGTLNDIYHTEKGDYTLTLKFYSGYYAGYLFFKRID